VSEVFGWRRVPPFLAVALGLLALGACLADVVSSTALHQSGPGGPAAEWLITSAVALPGTAVGVLLAARRPANPIGWLAVQVPRYRRSGADRRQQLKWLYSGAGVFVAALVATAVVPYFLGEAFGSDGPLANDTIELASSVMLVCIAVAVLKYRLYAIDRIISRVISYLIITAVLAGVFAGLVLLATQVLPFKAPVAVAAATLAAAALFNPLRREVQRMVDRRFNRTRYDAEAVVAAFTSRLRQTVDFDAVQGELLTTVHHAFQPAHVSLWSAAGDPRWP
jgi:hypothetical protein